MSLYLFIASNEPLDDVVNTKITYYSIEEAERLGLLQKTDLSLPNWWENINETDRRKENQIMWVENEDDLGELEIYPSKQSGMANGAHGLVDVSGYTQKAYIANVHIHCTDERIRQLISYIARHFENADDIEIWHIWVGNDEEKHPMVTKCKFTDLTVAQMEVACRPDLADLAIPCCLSIER